MPQISKFNASFARWLGQTPVRSASGVWKRMDEWLSEMGRASSGSAATVSIVSGTTHTLSSADHNTLLDCTNENGCSVTVPEGLSSGVDGEPFHCWLCTGPEGGALGSVTVLGDGVTVNATDENVVLTGAYARMELFEWPDGSFRLFGGTAPIE